MIVAPNKIKLSLLAVVLSFSVFAQVPDPPPPPPPGPPLEGFPIDGNIILLLMVGIVYGLFILKKFKFQTK